MATIEKTLDGYRRRSVIANLSRRLPALLTVIVTVFVSAGLLATIAYGLAPAFGYKVWMIDGGSMEPTIPKGSLVVSRHVDPEELRNGDIITFKPPDAKLGVTHRIIEITDTEGHLAFTTKGDANANPDPLDVDLTAGANRLEWSVPYLGRAVGFARGTSGMLLFLAAPALLLAALWLRDENESEEAGAVAG